MEDFMLNQTLNMPKYQVLFKKLDPNAKPFEYTREGDACMDMFALNTEVIPAFTTKIIKTGIAVQLPVNFEGIVRGRSGLATKDIIIHFGTIDETYRGDIGVIVFNNNNRDFIVTKHMRIAQFTIKPVIRFELIQTDQLSDTERGENGYGSSGV